jgi:vacuolar-type H+-ATPase subunit D/Vma8
MSKIKFVKNKFGNYVPLLSVKLELSEKQIKLLLDCIDDYQFNIDRIQRVNSTGFEKHIIPILISKLNNIDILNQTIGIIESN